MQMASRKRQCARDDESDDDAASDASEVSYWKSAKFLANMGRELLHASRVNIGKFLKDDHDCEISEKQIAIRIQDGLVEQWIGSQSEDSEKSPELRRKARLWRTRSPSPESE